MKIEDFDPNADLKKCPYCAEMVQANAVVCKHCGRDISTAGLIGRIGNSLLIIGVLIIVLVCAFWFILGSH